MTINYPHLFSPLKINTLMLKNRIIASSMGIIPTHKIISSTNYGNMSIFDKALGGAAVVHISSMVRDEEHAMFGKYNRDVTREEISVMKQAGARCSLQVGFHSVINEDGSVSGPIDGIRFDGRKMKMMTEADMDAIIRSMSIGICQARDFGFDMATIHFAHDSLCSQFLAPGLNKRTDDYGGFLENRIRFPLKTVEQIRKSVGPDFPIQMRISRHLMVPESYESEDMLYFIQNAAPYIDMVNVSCGIDRKSVV